MPKHSDPPQGQQCDEPPVHRQGGQERSRQQQHNRQLGDQQAHDRTGTTSHTRRGRGNPDSISQGRQTAGRGGREQPSGRRGRETGRIEQGNATGRHAPRDRSGGPNRHGGHRSTGGGNRNRNRDQPAQGSGGTGQTTGDNRGMGQRTFGNQRSVDTHTSASHGNPRGGSQRGEESDQGPSGHVGGHYGGGHSGHPSDLDIPGRSDDERHAGRGISDQDHRFGSRRGHGTRRRRPEGNSDQW